MMQQGNARQGRTVAAPAWSVWTSQLVPLALLLLAWQIATAGNARRAFFFGSPAGFWRELAAGVADGSLLVDAAVTGSEAVVGFVIGNLIGTATGLALWHSPWLFRTLRPYIIALGSAPLFAFAPLIVVWFGTGFTAKVVLATLSTVFVALMQSYKGAEEVNPGFVNLIRSFGGGRAQLFRKVIVPSSAVWVMAAFRLNVGLALLGAFLGEYISSERGLGHVILVAGGLYNISLVLAAVFLIVVLAWILAWLVGALERPLKHWLVENL